MGCGQGVPDAQGRVVECGAAVPRARPTLYDHIRRAPVRKTRGREAGRQCRGGFQDRRARGRGRVRMAVPVACLHGPGLRRGRDQGRPRHLLVGLAEAAFRARRHRRHARTCRPTRSTASGWSAPAPTAATTPTTAPWTPPCWPRRSAARCGCNTCASRAPAGTRKARPRSTARARRSTPPARSSPTSSPARASPASTCMTNGSKPRGHARRPFPRRAAQGQRRLRRAGGILRVRQQAHRVGDDRAVARPRLAAAQRPSARSGRAADPLRQRIVHGRGRRGARRSIRWSCACGTSRTRATSR